RLVWIHVQAAPGWVSGDGNQRNLGRIALTDITQAVEQESIAGVENADAARVQHVRVRSIYIRVIRFEGYNRHATNLNWLTCHGRDHAARRETPGDGQGRTG